MLTGQPFDSGFITRLEQQILALHVPLAGMSLAASGCRASVGLDGSRVALSLIVGFPLAGTHADGLRIAVAEVVAAHSCVLTSLDISVRIAAHAVQPGVAILPAIRNVIAVGSGKGGVGKSTTAVNLALALAGEGARVGLLDADVYGPSVPTMLGLSGRPDSPDGKMIEPMRAFGIEAMSIGLMVESDTPMIWRGPMATSALTQLLTQTLWGGPDGLGLDYLIVDLPPGTGDIQLTLAQKIPVAGAVIVTTPQEVATMDARKALRMFEKVQVPVLGLIENMAVHVCSQCGHAEHLFGTGGAQRMAEQYGVPLLGSLPLQIGIREQGDTGVPIVAAQPGSAAADCYRQAAIHMAAVLAARPRSAMPIASSLLGS
jgi:ATP-binding protein involved in chromosome partitioning